MHRPLIYSFSLSLFPSFWHQAQQQSERGGKSGQTRKRRTRNRWRGRTARASTLYCCCCCLCVCDPEKRDSRIHNTLLTTRTRIQVTLIRSLSLSLLERCISRRQLTRARPSLCSFSPSSYESPLLLQRQPLLQLLFCVLLFFIQSFSFLFPGFLTRLPPCDCCPTLHSISFSLASSRDAGVFPSSSSSLLSLSLLPVYGFLGHRVSLSLPQNLSSRQRERERGERKEVEESEWRSGEGGRREGE